MKYIFTENCPITIQESGSMLKGASDACLLASSSSNGPHPTIEDVDPLLFLIQRTPSSISHTIESKGSFELNWNYENKGLSNTKITNSKAAIYKSLKVKYFLIIDTILIFVSVKQY